MIMELTAVLPPEQSVDLDDSSSSARALLRVLARELRDMLIAQQSQQKPKKRVILSWFEL